MPDFNTKDALACPWTESTFFCQILERESLSVEQRSMAKQFAERGYIVIDLPDLDCERIISSLQTGAGVKTQESRYHYNPQGQRFFECWKWNQQVLDLARHPKILETLRFLYNREPIPFQTINFNRGTNQPLHSDTIHFHSVPPRWVSACWISLEDMDEKNGTLAYVPGSHKLPIYDFQDLGLARVAYGEQFASYAVYEDFIAKLVVNEGFNIRPFMAKKGQALLWSSNLLHGGMPIKDGNRTRWSQATHYFFSNCEKYYSPMFSEARLGIFSEKDLSSKDIRNHVIHEGE